MKFHGIFTLCIVFLAFIIFPNKAISQECDSLTATFIVQESRCASTGSIEILASGGSGNYQYRARGPINVSYTSSNILYGMAKGDYDVYVKDLITNCEFRQEHVIVPGNYRAPSFSLKGTGVTCINGNDGTISLTSQNNGRAPFSYQIMAPSTASVGTVSTTGDFTGLVTGTYYIRLSDSCGALQTRSVMILNYNWSINSYSVTKKGCDSFSVVLNLLDSYGNTTPNAVFDAFTYGASTTPGDTTWFTTNTFNYFKGNKHAVRLFVKDKCGNVKSVSWADTAIPAISGTVTITNRACSTFTATITGQVNLTTPQYCLYDRNNVLLSCNTTGIFTAVPFGTYCIDTRDNCYDTTIRRCFTVTPLVPAVSASLSIVTSCNTFNATVTGQSNLTSPNYCLYDAANTLVSCNATGLFNNIPTGAYCIRIVNDAACYDTVITRCITARRVIPSVSTVVISRRACSTFTATITGKSNIFNASYCLYDASNTLVNCNASGNFDDVPYGSYCMRVFNDTTCYDTVITRCFTVLRPVPSVNPVVSITNLACSTVTASITDTLNLSNPQFCLYTSPDSVLVTCNTTGVFNNVGYGSYCIQIANNPGCYDTTITRCFTRAYASPTLNAVVTTSNRLCSTFNASVGSLVGLVSPGFCLYDQANVLVSCNTTGIFTSLPYGSYCVAIKNNDPCFDTTIRRCFTQNKLVPAVGVSASVSSLICTGFTASVVGQTNLTNPQFFLLDSNGTQ